MLVELFNYAVFFHVSVICDLEHFHELLFSDELSSCIKIYMPVKQSFALRV